MLTQARLKELYDYSPESGDFTHRTTKRGGKKAGEAAGCIAPIGYRVIRIDRKLLYAHRLAWLYVYGEWPPQEIDHINGVRADNRIANLRAVSRRVNQQNMRKALRTSKSGLLGVIYSKKHRKYKAEITINGRNVFLGLFEDPQDAHQEYLTAKRVSHPGCTI